jgi:methyl-accepting chemotaxis protein
MLDRVGHSGVVTRDTPFIEQALTGAREIQTVINRALADGRLAPSALFDTRYQPIAGSDPQQYMTGFVPFADAEIRPLLDRQSANSNSVVGCCLIDRNGFLPTHITERSHPQRPGERLWNLENSRNRQIFMDRQTRQALDNESDWFLYTYRQDFGDGRYRALRSVLVPLVFAQQRWGLYEVGYLL